MKTYLIQAHGGKWDDAWTLPVKIVKTEERAKDVVEQYQKEADEHHEKMVWYQDNPDKMPEHLNDVTWDDGEVLCSEECLACEIESYCGDLDGAYYIYVEVEMED